MTPTAVPTRITIDFRDAVHPTRTWILGLADGEARVELLTAASATMAAAPPRPMSTRPTAETATCACPESCERDHANE